MKTMMISLSEKVLEILEEKHIKSGGHNGCRVPELCHQTDSTCQDMRETLRILYKQKRIKIRDGIHGYLIFINNEKK